MAGNLYFFRLLWQWWGCSIRIVPSSGTVFSGGDAVLWWWGPIRPILLNGLPRGYQTLPITPDPLTVGDWVHGQLDVVRRYKIRFLTPCPPIQSKIKN